MDNEKIYKGILTQNVFLHDTVAFTIVKTYPESGGITYLLIKVHNSENYPFFLIRKPCLTEYRSQFKYSSVIECGNDFYVLVKKILTIIAADNEVAKLTGKL